MLNKLRKKIVGKVGLIAMLILTLLVSSFGPLAAMEVSACGTAGNLGLSKSGPDQAKAGAEVTYTLTWKVKDDDQTGVTMTDYLPAGTTLVKASGNYKVVGNNQVVWDLGDVKLNGADHTKGHENITLKVSATVPNGTKITNQASLSSNEVAAVKAHKTTVIINQLPGNDFSLGLSKSAPKEAQAGTEITYTIDWSVKGNATAKNVTVVDALPSEVTFVSASDNGSYDATTRTVSWQLGDVTAPDNGSLTVKAKVAATATSGTVITNQAVITSGSQTAKATAQTTVTTKPYYDLNIKKTADKDKVNVGENLTYTLTYEVSGNTQAKNVIVADLLPAEVSVVDATQGYQTVTLPSGRTVIGWLVGDVDAGTTGSYQITVKVNSKPADGYLTNVAGIGANCTGKAGNYAELIDIYNQYGGGHVNTQCVTAQCPAPGCAKYDFDVLKTEVGENTPPASFTLDISKDAPQQAAPGTEITYTIDWSVKGNATAKNVTVVDALPSEVTFVSASDNGQYRLVGAPATQKAVSQHSQVPVSAYYYPYLSQHKYVTWNLGDITSDTHGTLTVKVKLNGSLKQGDEVKNTVTIFSGTQTAQADAKTVITTQPYYEFEIDKTADQSQVDTGDTLTYTIDWSVVGNADASDVQVIDSLPAEVTLQSADSSNNFSYTYDQNSHQIIWQLGTRSAGDSGTLTVVAKVDSRPANGELVNQATIKNADKQAEASVNVTVNSGGGGGGGYYDLHLNKTAPSRVEPGDEIEYTLDWSIYGNTSAYQVKLVDNLPSNVTFVSASDNGSYDAGNNTVTWDLGNLTAGSQGQYKVTVSTSGLTSGDEVVNEAVLSTNLKSVTAEAKTEIYKNSGGGGGGGGGGVITTPQVNLEYNYPAEKTTAQLYTETITVTNTGNVALTKVILKVDLPEGYINLISSSLNNYSYDTLTGVVTFNLGALSVAESRLVKIIIEPQQSGTNVVTKVTFDSRETRKEVSGSENLIQAPVTPSTPATPSQPTTAGTSVAAPQVAAAKIQVKALEQKQPVCPQESVDYCQSCHWWNWLLAILMQLLALVVYLFYVSREKIKEAEGGKYYVVKGRWAWLLPVALALVITYLLLAVICHLMPYWAIAVILISYYLALIGQAATIRLGELKYSPALPLLATVIAIAAYIIWPAWSWWLWLVVALIYGVTLLGHYIMVAKMDEKNRYLWWLAVSCLTLLVIVAELIVRWGQCHNLMR